MLGISLHASIQLMLATVIGTFEDHCLQLQFPFELFSLPCFVVKHGLDNEELSC